MWELLGELERLCGWEIGSQCFEDISGRLIELRVPTLGLWLQRRGPFVYMQIEGQCLKALPETLDHPTGKKGTLASAVYFHTQTS